jgi:ABC-2 type transport system permease protein
MKIVRLRFYLDIYRRLLSVQIRGQLQYRVAFVLDLLATALTLGMLFVVLALIFQRFDNLGGWSLGEVAFLFGLVEISFGLMDMLFSGFDPAIFGRRVRMGTFDQLLLRPLNITLQVLGDDFALRRLGRVAQGVVIFLIALQLANVEWTLGKALYLPLVIGGLICYFGGLFVAGSTITFWTIESVEMINVLTYGGAEMLSYPMHIYPDWLRRTFTYGLPAIFLNYFPALYFLDKPLPAGVPSWAPFVSPLVGVAILALSLAFWRTGIRHYQSSGS